MGRAFCLSLTFALCATLVNSLAERHNIAHPNTEFAFKLYKKVADSNFGKNILLSPVSISSTLAMVFTGAEGETKSQMMAAMGLGLNRYKEDDVSQAFKYIIQELKILSSSSTLHLARRLYGQAGHTFKDEYLQAISSYYGATLEALDFKGDASGARDVMNNWVSNMTSNKIKELFAKGSITSDTVLVLVSAAYFKGSWVYEFDKEVTQLQRFHLSMSQESKVLMMNLGPMHGLRYVNSTDLRSQVLELHYTDKNVSMYVFLPHEIEGLSSVEERLDTRRLIAATNGLKYSYVRATLPKFVLEHTLDLKESLQAVGMVDVFDVEKADLSKIVDSGNLALSRVTHKASLPVDEIGTEATEPPGISVNVKSKRTPIDFTVDRPFLFLLMERKTASILFLGRVTNPPNAK